MLRVSNVADVDLIRQGGSLQAVLQREARVGEPRRVHQQIVETLIDGNRSAVFRAPKNRPYLELADVVRHEGEVDHHVSRMASP